VRPEGARDAPVGKAQIKWRLDEWVRIIRANPIESALSATRRVTARVTRWRDGGMRKRWCAAGLLRAESKFRRLRSYRAMPTLLKALESLVREQRAGSKQRVA
jgi:hypothetical protein